MARLLIVEDNDTLREGIVQVVRRMGHEALAAPHGRAGLAAFTEHRPDLVITDLKMDQMSGMEMMKAILEDTPAALVIIVTAFGSIEKAVEAMQQGAFDFLPKPFPPDLLRTKISRALDVLDAREQTARLAGENEMLRRDAAEQHDHALVGDSPPMRAIYTMIDKVARADSTVYIHGESGTGKELVARAIHDASPRGAGPFIRVNCSALADNLLESELFGHEKGAFTGAHKRRLGRFELADGGTLFLDEIGDISPATQVKLLRVLQERSFERVGGEQTIEVDVRVLTATHRDLQARVAEGAFREDLFYRLHIIPIELPPLRARPGDVELLVDHFVDKLAQRTRSHVVGVRPEAMQSLRAYAWPGNVRELENVIEHAMVFAEGQLIDVADLPSRISGLHADAMLSIPEGDRSLPDILEELERQLIVRAFRQADGVKTATARQLGIKASALYYKLDKYDIDERVLDA